MSKKEKQQEEQKENKQQRDRSKDFKLIYIICNYVRIYNMTGFFNKKIK